MGKIAGLVVAAGYSSRMGTFKPLLPLGEATVIENTINSLLRAGIDDIKVVVGHRAEELKPLLDKMNVEIIFNEDYDRGMYSSVQKGVASFKLDVEAFFMLPGDIPLVRAKTITDLINTYYLEKAKIVYPVFDGRRGHPPLISTSLTGHILSWDQPGGMKALLEQFDHNAVEVEVIDEAIHFDMDNTNSYKKVQQLHHLNGNPSIVECQAIFLKFGTTERIINHCQAVADFAVQMAIWLNRTGYNLDINLVRAGAMLHDLAKGTPQHARAGGRILRDMAFPGVAEVVEAHMDINWQKSILGEREVVFLADKLFKEDRFVTLETRFLDAYIKFKRQPEVLAEVQKRLKTAREIKETIEALLNCTLSRAFEEAI